MVEGRILMRIEGLSSVTPVRTVPRVQASPHQGKAGQLRGDPARVNGTSNVGEADILKSVEQANKALEGTNRRFEYSVHEETNTIMVKVIDGETDELIREIPPEKILNLIAKLWELAGIIVDEKV
jgi:flagellar protein FlaG